MVGCAHAPAFVTPQHLDYNQSLCQPSLSWRREDPPVGTVSLYLVVSDTPFTLQLENYKDFNFMLWLWTSLNWSVSWVVNTNNHIPIYDHEIKNTKYGVFARGVTENKCWGHVGCCSQMFSVLNHFSDHAGLVFINIITFFFLNITLTVFLWAFPPLNAGGEKVSSYPVCSIINTQMYKPLSFEFHLLLFDTRQLSITVLGGELKKTLSKNPLTNKNVFF